MAYKPVNKELIDAVRADDLAGAQSALEFFANVDIKYKRISVLCWAIENANLEMVELLLNSGANPNLKSANGHPLVIAARKGHIDIIKSLIGYGAKVNTSATACFEGGYTPLHAAAAFGVHRIFESGASDTPAVEIVELLLEAGAHINPRDKDGLSPLSIAAQSGDQDVVTSLIAHGAQLEINNKYGYTPLGLAVVNQNVSVAEILLEAGANVNAEIIYTKSKIGGFRVAISQHPELSVAMKTLIDSFGVKARIEMHSNMNDALARTVDRATAAGGFVMEW